MSKKQKRPDYYEIASLVIQAVIALATLIAAIKS